MSAKDAALGPIRLSAVLQFLGRKSCRKLQLTNALVRLVRGTGSPRPVVVEGQALVAVSALKTSTSA